MIKRDLIIHLPVIHKGYLDFFSAQRNNIEKIYILDPDFLTKLSDFAPGIASLDGKTVTEFLRTFGLQHTDVLTENGVGDIVKHPLMLIQDEISRNLAGKYLAGADIEWKSVFLRWDRDSVSAVTPLDEENSADPFDKQMMKLAYSKAENSSDWWRQVGAVLVKDGREGLAAYNESFPNDHVPYQVGAVRDYLPVGERPDLSNTIHAEQCIIALAAKHGVSLTGSSLYVTHFPCAVCAKLIACAGIKKCFFGEGSANLDGKEVMRAAGVLCDNI
ncbi:MAG: deaminase [Candidatus Vogelbacteria bacterium]|nr:deaminase [Candidatus Vogelbacteria bacterium]